MIPRPSTSTLFPYTTLFRSLLPPNGGHTRLPACRQGVENRRATARVRGSGSGAGRVLRSARSEEHTSELQSQSNLVCRLLLEKKNAYVQMYTGIAQVGRCKV